MSAGGPPQLSPMSRVVAAIRTASAHENDLAPPPASPLRTVSARSDALARELQASRQEELAMSSPLSLMAAGGEAAEARPASAAALRTVSARSDALARELQASRQEELAMSSPLSLLVVDEARAEPPPFVGAFSCALCDLHCAFVDPLFCTSTVVVAQRFCFVCCAHRHAHASATHSPCSRGHVVLADATPSLCEASSRFQRISKAATIL